jgi:hypothetical protein
MLDDLLSPGDLIIVYGWTRKKDDITDSDLSKCLFVGEGIVVQSAVRDLIIEEVKEETTLYQILMLTGEEKGSKIWCLCGAEGLGIYIDWSQDEWERVCEFEKG